MTHYDDDPFGPIILWKDYGLEGWFPTSFDNDHDALVFMEGREGPFVVTHRMTPRFRLALDSDAYESREMENNK